MTTTAQQIKSGIYRITINKKIYIGSAINLKTRKSSHISKLKKCIHPNKIMQNAFNKYGVFNFEIIEIVENKENLIEREQYYIDDIKPECNIRKIANSNLGMLMSKETKNKISLAITGIKRSQETKEKCRVAKIGELNHNFGKISCNRGKHQIAHNKGIPMKEVSKIKICMTKSKLVEEQIIQIKQMILKKIPQNIIAKNFNIDPSTISKIKSGKRFCFIN